MAGARSAALDSGTPVEVRSGSDGQYIEATYIGRVGEFDLVADWRGVLTAVPVGSVSPAVPRRVF